MTELLDRPPPPASHVLVTFILIPVTYLWMMMIYAVAAIFLPMTITRDTLNMLAMLGIAALAGGVLSGWIPRVARQAVLIAATPLAVMCLGCGWITGWLGPGILGSIFFLNIFKIAYLKKFCFESVDETPERRHAMEIKVIIPLVLELIVVLAGLVVASSINLLAPVR